MSDRSSNYIVYEIDGSFMKVRPRYTSGRWGGAKVAGTAHYHISEAHPAPARNPQRGIIFDKKLPERSLSLGGFTSRRG